MATRQLRQAMYVHPMTIIAQLSNKQISDHRDKTRRHLPPSPLCLSLSLSFSLPIHPIMIILRRRFRVLFSNARSRPVCRSVGRRRGVMRGLATAAAVATTVIGAATAAGVNARPSKPLTRRGYQFGGLWLEFRHKWTRHQYRTRLLCQQSDHNHANLVPRLVRTKTQDEMAIHPKEQESLSASPHSSVVRSPPFFFLPSFLPSYATTDRSRALWVLTQRTDAGKSALHLHRGEQRRPSVRQSIRPRPPVVLAKRRSGALSAVERAGSGANRTASDDPVPRSAKQGGWGWTAAQGTFAGPPQMYYFLRPYFKLWIIRPTIVVLEQPSVDIK